MFWTYIIRLSNERYYIGQTSDLHQRLIRHQNGYNKYTKPYRPVALVVSVEHTTRSEAVREERKLKSNKSVRHIEEYIKANGGLIV